MSNDTVQLMTFEAFLADYKLFIEQLPGTVNLPQGYWQNFRGWDYWMILQHADFSMRDLVLDVGAMHTFGCLYWNCHVGGVYAVDSYAWGQRDYAKGLMTPMEWESVVTYLGEGTVTAFDADVQDLDDDIEMPRFDKILCISTIEHVIDDRKAMAEMYKVLRPGGKLLLTTEYHPTKGKKYAEDDGSFYRVYTTKAMGALLDGYPVTALVPDKPRDPFTTIFVCVEKPL